MTRESDSHVSSRRPARKKKASTAAKHQEHDPGEEEVGDVEGGDREPVDALARAAVWSRLDVRLHGPFETACGVAKYLVSIIFSSLKVLRSFRGPSRGQTRLHYSAVIVRLLL